MFLYKAVYFASDRWGINKKAEVQIEGDNFVLHEQFPLVVVDKRWVLVPKSQAIKGGKASRISHNTVYINC